MKFKNLLLIPLLVASLQAASVSDLTFTLINGNTEYSVSDCNGSASGSLIIPSNYNGLPVTQIGYLAFRGCSSVSSITIPGSVTSIGIYAFQDCSSLSSVTIGDSVTTIDWRAFEGCTSLASISIPNSVTSIGDLAFKDCTSLTSISLPDNMTFIGANIFKNCTNFSYDYTDQDLNYLISRSGQTAYLVVGVSASGSVNIPALVNTADVKLICSSAFAGCTGVVSITIPDSVTSIGESTFDGCSNLISITIPDSVTSIGKDAFRDCTGLSSVTIPDSVTSIGDNAFENCNGLNSITIPDGVTSIGTGAFNDCTSLTGIVVSSVNTFYSSIDGVVFNNAGDTLLIYPEGKSANSYDIPDGVTSIGTSAFNGCTGLTSITIPDSVTSIGWNVFQGCTNLSSVIFNGDAPPLIDPDLFGNIDSVTVYYYEDATGFTSPTWQEIQTKAISRFAPVIFDPVIAGIEKLEVGVNLWFNSAIGESYRIESSYDLENWTILEDQIPASSELIERLYSTDDYSRRFFRVILNTVEFTFIGTNNHDFGVYYGDEAIISAANIPLYPTGTDKYYLASYQVIEWSSNTPIGGLQYGRPKVTVATTSSLIGHNLKIRFFKYDSDNANNFSSAGPVLTIDGDALAQQDQTVESVSGVNVASQLGYSVRVWKEAKP